MIFIPKLCCLMLLCAGLLMANPARAVTLGQVDNFEDGTTQGWMVAVLGAPHPAPPDNIPSGGPAGINDNYLQLTAIGGLGPGSRLTVINLSQWTGDYLAAEISFIFMDVNNFSNTDLALRLLVADPVGGPPNNLAFSTDPIIVPANSGWQHIEFPFTANDLTAGIGTVAAALSNATEFRIFHNPDPNFPGPAVTAVLGVDNITAAPLPSSLLLLGGGLLGLMGQTRRMSG
jgi:hypothetical protein